MYFASFTLIQLQISFASIVHRAEHKVALTTSLFSVHCVPEFCPVCGSTFSTQMDTPLSLGSDHGSLSLGQPSSHVQPNTISGISEGLRHMEVEPTRRSKRTRQAFAIGDLHTCVCRETADPQSDNVIPCKQMG